MTVNKRKKNTRQRGGRWHGWGRGHAHHKGAGNRGGRGNAGTGKRSDHNKRKIYTVENYFGKFGFRKKGQIIHFRVVNTDYLEKNIDRLVKEKKAELKNGVYNVDLIKIGYDKLLAKDKVKRKFNITCIAASAGAKEKIEAAGGSIKLLGNTAGEAETTE
jgi:large subunit ribosomal protein L15